MESVVTETPGCSFDFNLLKSVQQPSKQDSSHTYTSDYSESTDEEADNNNDLIDQFKQLSFVDAPDSKYITPKPTNKTSEVNSQEEDSYGGLILVENKDIEEIQSSSFSFKTKESLKFVTEADGESTFRDCSNKNCGIYSKKKSETEKNYFDGNLESVENQISSLSLKNNKISNKCYENNYDTSNDDESDSDYDEQKESVTLRERGHTKHNRPQNNRQQRPTPFTQNASTSSPHFNSNCLRTFENFSPSVSHVHTGHHRPQNNRLQRPTPFTQNESTSSHHFNSNCLQTFENFRPDVSFGSNTPHDSYNSNSRINNNDLETYRAVHSSSTTLYSDFPTSEWESHQIFESVASRTATNEVVNDGVPYTEETVPEYVVPSEEATRNLNDQFSSEPNDTSLFDNSNERRFSGYAEVNVEAEYSSDSGLENLTEEEFLNIVGSITDSTSDDFSGQNPLDISNENLVQFSNEDLNIISDSPIPDQNFYPSSIRLYSDFPTSEWETHQVLGRVASSTTADEVVNNGVSYTVDAAPEYAVPYEEHLNDQLSSEPNDTSFFHNSNERSFPGYAEDYVEIENSSGFGFENLTEEECLNILRTSTDLTSVDLSSQNPLDISNENLVQFSNADLNIINDSTIPDQNFHPSSTTLYSDVPTSEWETHQIFRSAASSTATDEAVNNGVSYTEEAVLEYVVPSEEATRNLNDQFSSEPNDTSLFDNSNERSFSGYVEGYIETENFDSDSGLENLTEEEFPNIVGSVTDSTSDDLSGQNPVDVSNKNLVQLSDKDLDFISVSSDSTIPGQNGIQSIEEAYPNNNQEEVQPRNNIDQTNTSSNRTEETQIYTSYGTSARALLFNSPSFCKTKWESEYEDFRQQIQSGKLGTEEKTVIHMIPKRRNTKYRGTNLHYAIREEKTERVFSLVECHKACHGCLNTKINLVDNANKTVLDYSKEKKLDLLTAYLEENEAKSYSYICN